MPQEQKGRLLGPCFPPQSPFPAEQFPPLISHQDLPLGGSLGKGVLPHPISSLEQKGL